MEADRNCSNMEEAISIQPFASLKPQNELRESSLEYYRYLSERVEKSPLSFSGNKYFPELQKKEEK